MQECFYLVAAVLNNPYLARCDKPPEIHEAVHRRIHREKIGVNHRYREFSDMRTRAPSEKGRGCVTEILSRKIRLPLKDRSYSHASQVRLSDGCWRVGFSGLECDRMLIVFLKQLHC